ARGPASAAPPISPACRPPLAPGRDCVPGDPGALISRDGRTALVVVPVSGASADDGFRELVGDMRDRAVAAAPGARVDVSGPAGILDDAVRVFSQGDRVLMAGTILLVLVILLAVYRAPLMAVLPLVSVAVAMRITETVGAVLADRGVLTVSNQTASIMTVLLFGLGTDYALIITMRFREELAGGASPVEAMRAAMQRVGEMVLSSAATIVLAMFALLACTLPTLRQFGPYFVLGTVVMALVAFSFLPALTLLCGRAVFWPGKVDRQRSGSRLWRRAADLVLAAPRRVAVLTTVFLVALSLGALDYRETFDTASGFRVQTGAVDGRDAIGEAFGPGEVAPGTVLLTGGNLTPQRVQAAAEGLRRALPDRVARTAFVPRADLAGGGARVSVVLRHDPYSPAALDAVGPVRDAAVRAARDAGITDARAYVAGETASTADIRDALDRDVWVLVPLVLAIVAVVLGLLLRSLLAPVYLVATSVLSFAATVGVLVLCAVTLGGDDGVGNRVLAYVFVFVTALGIDYTIFIMGRYRQELLTSPPSEALRTAIATTGGVISSAGVILAATFGVLMTQPVRELYQFGLAMAIGLLLDTFVVRPLLVPAIVALLGRRALWPARPPVGD
ncbi:MAG: MMPL family transporter, partial [Thermoleophilia bacterium]|nr:MMPL family transporter [Thermoleophilia bacterium]